MSREFRRRRAIGAEVTGGGVHFRVWAPSRKRVDVVIDPKGEIAALEREPTGHFSGLLEGISAGARYRFLLDGQDGPFPDPASRFQPEGPHGPSEVVDPEAFRWRSRWSGLAEDGLVLYEMHIGTYTPEGTFESAARHLPELADLGITLIEVMPIADFPGTFGWGYDGVDLWAPTRLYGTPDDFRRFIDAAHAHGIGVILDVVYNHFGPDGNYLGRYSPSFETDRYENEWGGAVNYDGEGSDGVREFVSENAAYWIDEFHLDGLRLDATQQIFDNADHEHILARVARYARGAAGGRRIFVVAENEPQHAKFVRPVDQGGHGLDAIVNDDLHHSFRAALTGRREAYVSMHRGTPQELISGMKWGILYQGQWYAWQKGFRGTPALDVAPSHLVAFLENHDQVANTAFGKRLSKLSHPGDLRAATALILLGPQIPMLFQGQEFGSSSPFVYFADHNPELAPIVSEGRREFLTQFPSSASVRDRIPDAGDRATFERCVIDHSERERGRSLVALHRDLLALRRNDPCFSQHRSDLLHGAVIADNAFLLRYLTGGKNDRLLVINFGRDVALDSIAEPLFAPPEGFAWNVIWSSEAPEYGGSGSPEFDAKRPGIAAHSALVFTLGENTGE